MKVSAACSGSIPSAPARRPEKLSGANGHGVAKPADVRAGPGSGPSRLRTPSATSTTIRAAGGHGPRGRILKTLCGKAGSGSRSKGTSPCGAPRAAARNLLPGSVSAGVASLEGGARLGGEDPVGAHDRPRPRADLQAPGERAVVHRLVPDHQDRILALESRLQPVIRHPVLPVVDPFEEVVVPLAGLPRHDRLGRLRRELEGVVVGEGPAPDRAQPLRDPDPVPCREGKRLARLADQRRRPGPAPAGEDRRGDLEPVRGRGARIGGGQGDHRRAEDDLDPVAPCPPLGPPLRRGAEDPERGRLGRGGERGGGERGREERSGEEHAPEETRHGSGHSDSPEARGASADRSAKSTP